MTDLLPVAILLAIGLSLLFLEKLQESTANAKRSACNGRLAGIASAMLSYHETNGRYPPAQVIGPDGKPWHTWRVLLLPYLGGNELYDLYRFDEPWNGPNNRKLASRMPEIYACPADPDRFAAHRTNYFVVVGLDTIFKDRIEADFYDPRQPSRILGRVPLSLASWQVRRPDATILLVESTSLAVNWMEPLDLPFDSMCFTDCNPPATGISSRHRLPQIAFADGTRRTLEGLNAETIRRMCLVDPDKKPDAPPVGKAFAE